MQDFLDKADAFFKDILDGIKEILNAVSEFLSSLGVKH